MCLLREQSPDEDVGSRAQTSRAWAGPRLAAGRGEQARETSEEPGDRPRAALGRTAAAARARGGGPVAAEGGGAANNHGPCQLSRQLRSLEVPLSPGEGTTSLLQGLEDAIAACSLLPSAL